MSIKHEMIKQKIDAGEDVTYKEGGNSMTPILKHREPVTLSPVDASKLEAGDIVLVKVKGTYYTHLVSATDANRVQISNNHGRVNGWVKREKAIGIVTAVSGTPRASALSKVKRL